jgi:uncharacterized coiled-coil protein SlyX
MEMTSDFENLVLEHMRYIRGSVDRMDQRLSDQTNRIGRLETTVTQIHVTLAEHSVRFDRLEARLDRIEKRLDLAEV